MNILKIPRIQPSDYFWYFYRCIDYLEKNNIAKIEYYNSNIDERYVMQFFFNNQPVWIDVSDDNKLSPTYKDKFDSIIFKSNYSTELWNNPPENFIYKNEEWEYKLQSNIKPFILGRAFKQRYDLNEFQQYTPQNIELIYDVFSFSGSGITEESSLIRLKIYDLFSNISNKKLIFWLRKHGDYIWSKAVEEQAQKYECKSPTWGIENYYKMIAQAKYSINFPGICVSPPFRCIDAILSGRAIISTKIWTDIYKTFPCIELPICGYFGSGDWEKAKEIILNLNNYDYQDLANKAKDWYSWYLSPEGMWRNQILKNLC